MLTMIREAEPAYESILSFGGFVLRTSSRVLLKDGHPINLGSRAFEILLGLIENRGEIVSNAVLAQRAWPTTTVDVSNLKVQIVGLRKVLADNGAVDQIIRNVPNRGYLFTCPVIRTRSIAAPVGAPRPNAGNLPGYLGRIYGRAEAMSLIGKQLELNRLVTIVGPGGIGKTTVALAIAGSSDVEFAWFVDLSGLTDPALVATAVATTLGLVTTSIDPIGKVIEYLQRKRSLIVLDNCEHLIDVCAEIASALITAVQGVSVIATSREPLRIAHEQVSRLDPLATPTRLSMSCAEAMTYPAIQLFVDRAKSHIGFFEVAEDDVHLLIAVCQRLDGVPLALELAAGAVGAIGLRVLTSRITEHFDGLNRGQRTASPRQQTIRATLDWSYALLTKEEQDLLCRLGIFSGSFTLEATAAVCEGSAGQSIETVRALAELADKSLVVVDARGETVLYRLLETTKAYARERLFVSKDFGAVRSCYCAHISDIFREAQTSWTTHDAGAWADRLRYWINDVRQCLDWASAHTGDLDRSASLLVDSAQLWQYLGLLREFVSRSAIVIDQPIDEPKRRMLLAQKLGHAIYELDSPPAMLGRMHDCFEMALTIARELDDKQCEFAILISQCTGRAALGDYASMEPIARSALAVGTAAGIRDAKLFYNRAMVAAKALLGEFVEAERYIAAALADPGIYEPVSHDTGFVFDPELFTLANKARVAFIRGFADQAKETLSDVLRRTMRLGHMPTYGYVLRQALPLSVWLGDEGFVRDDLGGFLRYGERRNLDYHQVWKTFISWGFRASAEDWTSEHGRSVIRESGIVLSNYARQMLTSLHPSLMTPGVLDAVRTGRGGWCAAEAIRSNGVSRLGWGDLAGAEAAFREAVEVARGQEALAWELRAATSLATLLIRRGEDAEAREILGAVLGRFTEGFATYDVKLATRILAEASG